MNKKGIAIAGSLICDVYYRTDTYPQLGHLTQIRSLDRGVGGLGNMTIDLAKLDSNLSVKVSAMTGEDENGDFVKEQLNAYPNISTKNLTQEGESATTLVIEGNDTKQRTFFHYAGANRYYDESYIQWEDIQADIFHLEYLLLLDKVDAKDPVYGTHGAKILHDAKDRGMKTSIDIVSELGERMQEIVIPALKYTDYCTINEVEAQGLTGIPLLEDGQLKEESVREALKKLADLGVSKWAVIHSPTVGFGLDCMSGEIVKVNSLKLPEGYIQGTTGAGDAFCSGILYGAYAQMSLEESLKLAVACGACSLSDKSSTGGMRSFDEVMIEYEKYKKEL